MEAQNDTNIIYGGDLDPIEVSSLGQMILSDLKSGDTKPAIINGKTGKTWTYRELSSQSVAMCKVLHGAGIRRNDVISFVSENRHEISAIAFGAFYLNAVIAPINVTYTERELRHALELSKPRFVFVSPHAATKTMAVCSTLKFVEKVIIFERGKAGASSLADFVKKYENTNFDVHQAVQEKIDTKEQIAMIFCSSGTTGMPKGVLTTQENMIACMQGFRGTMDYLEDLHNISTVGLNIAPWFHVLGFLSMFMFACSRRFVFVFLPSFDEATFYKTIETYKVNYAVAVPPIMVMLAKSPMFDKYDLTSLRDISCGAASLSKEVEDQVRERFKGRVTIRQGYGMSETTYGVTGSVAKIKAGSIGEAVRGIYVKVVDESGKPLGSNKPGELCFKGSRIMKGYINNPEASKEAIDKDGWLHSGDIGYYDEDKQFYIVDRLKELIKYKAYQVPPAEIEGLLLSNPKVKDSGVIGIPDESSGELPFAFVVKQPGAKLTEREVMDFVAKNTSKAKWIRGGVKFIDAIPKNPSGKILRRELRELYKSMKAKL